jgi:hypothetical protein
MMWGGAVVICMVSSKALATNLLQGAVVFVMVRQILITLEAVWEGGGRPRSLTLLTREEANVSLRNCPTFEAVVTIFVDPF